MKKVVLCFNCLKQVSRKERTETVEHIPAQSLFAGFGDDYKINRITVPCCTDCNNESSIALDEEFRNMIGAITNRAGSSKIVENTIKSMLIHNRQFDSLPQDQNGKLLGLVSFETSPLIDYQIKVFKGIFYHKYKYPLPLEYNLVVDSNHDGKNLSHPFIHGYLLKHFEYKHSGHPRIFKYVLQPFREVFLQSNKTDLVPTTSDHYYVGLLVFNESFASVVYASLPD